MGDRRSGPKSETRLYVCQIHEKFHSSIKHSIPSHCGIESSNSENIEQRNEYKAKQESLANAKVSTRQPWYIGCNSLNRPPLRIAQQYQRNLYIVEKCFQRATIPSLTMPVYLHYDSFSRCCLPNMPTSAKFRENLDVQQFKVIQGWWFQYQSKVHRPMPFHISH